MARVLITRAEPEASALAHLLESCGHNAVLAPLAQIYQNAIYTPLLLPEALIFTSRNAPQYAPPHYNLPTFAIGPRTAQAARAAGFQHIIADGDGIYAQLMSHIIASGFRTVWHIGGSDVRHDMAADLAAHGIKCHHLPFYGMRAVEDIPPAAKTAIAARALDMGLILSPQTAKRANTLLGADVRNWLPLWVLSDAIAEPLQAAGWRHVHISSQPSLLQLLAEAGLMCEEGRSILKGMDHDR